MAEIKAFKFTTNYIDWNEYGLKGEREHYVTGYISTDEVDRAGEVVTREAMKNMVEQLNQGNVKLDIEHGTFTSEKDIPIGKIVEAKYVEHEGKSKIWIKAKLNKSHSKFQEVWKSIKEGFLDAYSIAYQVKDAVSSILNDMPVKMLKSLELLNVAITGNPVNKGATMTESFTKSLEVINMENEEKQPKENVPQEQTQNENVPKQEEETPKEETPKTEEKSEPKKETPEKEDKEEEDESKDKKEEVKSNPLDMIKSLQKENNDLKEALIELKGNKDLEIKSVQAQIAELKAELEKPQLKSLLSEPPKTQINKKSNPLDLI